MNLYSGARSRVYSFAWETNLGILMKREFPIPTEHTPHPTPSSSSAIAVARAVRISENPET